jgi:hypothetical protein
LSAERQPLACPTCARKFSLDERFCPYCEMPLVYVGRDELEPITAAHEKARKVKPQYTGGEPVKVAFAQNLAEAQLVQGILLEEGIPSFERRSRGFDVPDFLAAGPRDILVPSSAADAAREALAGEGAPVTSADAHDSAIVSDPRRFVVGFLIALGGGAALVLLAYELVK